MSEVFNYAAIVGFCAIIVDVIILLFKTETVERILLNERKKLLADFARVIILGFVISLVLFNYLKKEPSFSNNYAYVATFIISLFLSGELYWIAIWTMDGIGFGKNYFIDDEEHGRLYLIKSSNEKYILLADKPRVKDSKFVIFKDKSVIESKKIYSEPKKANNGHVPGEGVETVISSEQQIVDDLQG